MDPGGPRRNYNGLIRLNFSFFKFILNNSEHISKLIRYMVLELNDKKRMRQISKVLPPSLSLRFAEEKKRFQKK